MRKKILIVDDEITGRLLEYNLKKEGYKVYSVFNGKEAIAKAEKTKPDLIITDVMMPHMNGFEFLEKLRSDIKTSSIPVVFFTARGQAADIQKGLMCFVSHLCLATVTLPPTPSFTACEKGSEDEKWGMFPDHIRQYIRDEANKELRKKCQVVKDLFRRPCSLDNRWRTELPSYSLIIIATATAVIALWVS